VCIGAMLVTALAHAVVFLRRQLQGNQISTIDNGTFAGLTALTELYGAGLWVRDVLNACCLVFAWMWGAEGLFAGLLLLVLIFSSYPVRRLPMLSHSFYGTMLFFFAFLHRALFLDIQIEVYVQICMYLYLCLCVHMCLCAMSGKMVEASGFLLLLAFGSVERG
jgi:hypothetical protein